jgi:hypothetical protein
MRNISDFLIGRIPSPTFDAWLGAQPDRFDEARELVNFDSLRKVSA